MAKPPSIRLKHSLAKRNNNKKSENSYVGKKLYFKCPTFGCLKEVNPSNGKHNGQCLIPENFCLGCGEDLGENNPRQYCMKTYCPFETYCPFDISD